MASSTPPAPSPSPSQPSQPGRIARRHDLDALRAIAMLLGIVLHAGLSFTTVGWVVQDVRTHQLFDMIFMGIHGFRMPLFFLVSGFFTAMLWRKRGIKKLLKHRFIRIFLPLMLGLVTIVPLVSVIGFLALTTRGNGGPKGVAAGWVESVRAGSVDQFKDAIAADPAMDINAADPESKMPALQYASLMDAPELVAWLIENGAEVNMQNHENTTALHNAAFLGRVETVRILLDAGADPELRRHDGSRPEESARAPWEITSWILGILKIDAERDQVLADRKRVIAMLQAHGKGQAFDEAAVKEAEASGMSEKRERSGFGKVYNRLTQGSIWHHLWFLMFLCWLVLIFGLYAWAMDKVGIDRIPKWLVLAPGCLLWVIPFTMVPQLFMEQGTFGPDTSAGLLPKQHMLVYYGIFFGFGALYFDAKDESGRLGRWWWFTLPLSLVLFPLAMDFKHGGFGIRENLVSPEHFELGSNLLQVTFTWTMTLAWIGMFRTFFSKESKVMRYISDSSYWLYLAHLPLVMFAQWLVRNWEVPALLKFLIITVPSCAFLIFTYEYLVRYTPIGTLLNGKKTRPEVVDSIQ